MTNIEDLGAHDARATEDALAESVHDLRGEIDELRSEIARLDADLGESRRLNLRAAELLDLVYERLGSPAADDAAAGDGPRN
jgi:uncharacterized small protein (DUF1192 family)